MNQEQKSKENMDFGLALKYLKSGYKVARRGFGDADTYLYHVPEHVKKDFTSYKEKSNNSIGLIDCNAYIACRKPTSISIYVANNEDILATDWYIVE